MAKKDDFVLNAVILCAIIYVLLVYVIPIVAIILIPILIIAFIIAIFSSKAEKKKQLQRQKLEGYVLSKMLEYDTCDKDEFAKLVGDLIQGCIEKGYGLSSKTIYSFYPTIDTVGIGEVRKIFGKFYEPNRALVTNRKLTRQAREFCRAAYITVIDRNDLIGLLTYYYPYTVETENFFTPVQKVQCQDVVHESKHIHNSKCVGLLDVLSADEETVKKLKPNKFDYPDEFDHFGEEHDTFEGWCEECEEHEDDLE